jgi:hypothetical protein
MLAENFDRLFRKKNRDHQDSGQGSTKRPGLVAEMPGSARRWWFSAAAQEVSRMIASWRLPCGGRGGAHPAHRPREHSSQPLEHTSRRI